MKQLFFMFILVSGFANAEIVKISIKYINKSKQNIPKYGGIYLEIDDNATIEQLKEEIVNYIRKDPNLGIDPADPTPFKITLSHSGKYLEPYLNRTVKEMRLSEIVIDLLIENI